MSEPPETGDCDAASRKVMPSVRADLERLVRIPSVSADPARPHLDASAEVVAAAGGAGLTEVEIVSADGGLPP